MASSFPQNEEHKPSDGQANSCGSSKEDPSNGLDIGRHPTYLNKYIKVEEDEVMAFKIQRKDNKLAQRRAHEPYTVED